MALTAALSYKGNYKGNHVRHVTVKNILEIYWESVTAHPEQSNICFGLAHHLTLKAITERYEAVPRFLSWPLRHKGNSLVSKSYA